MINIHPPTNTTKNKRGQALLLIIMVLAVVSTIAGTTAYQSTQATKTAKAAQESKTAFAAAEGILNQVLNGATPDSTIFTNLNQAVEPVITGVKSETGLTTKIDRDRAVTIYTANYEPSTNTFAGGYVPGNIKLHFALVDAGDDGCPVLEVIKISDNDRVTRQFSGSCNGHTITEGAADTSVAQATRETATITGTTFYRSMTVNLGGNTKLLIVRSLYSGTTIGINSTLPPQGVQISATARTVGGAQKTVRVFRSFPQIPVDLLTTRF